jgi:tripartite-type tricarboxylate transporter receptor subunit TctC
MPGFRSVVWWAVLVPRGTPGEIVARLNSDFGRIVKLPEVQERYASLGVFTEHSTPQQVTERMKSDLQEFAKILKAAGVEAE